MSEENGWYKKNLSKDTILLYRVNKGMVTQRFKYKRRGGVNPRIYATFLNKEGLIEEYTNWRTAGQIFEAHYEKATLVPTGEVESF